MPMVETGRLTHHGDDLSAGWPPGLRWPGAGQLAIDPWVEGARGASGGRSSRGSGPPRWSGATCHVAGDTRRRSAASSSSRSGHVLPDEWASGRARRWRDHPTPFRLLVCASSAAFRCPSLLLDEVRQQGAQGSPCAVAHEAWSSLVRRPSAPREGRSARSSPGWGRTAGREIGADHEQEGRSCIMACSQTRSRATRSYPRRRIVVLDEFPSAERMHDGSFQHAGELDELGVRAPAHPVRRGW